MKSNIIVNNRSVNQLFKILVLKHLTFKYNGLDKIFSINNFINFNFRDCKVLLTGPILFCFRRIFNESNWWLILPSDI